MAYSQQTLIGIIKSGKVFGEIGIPRHIETVISHVFLFEKTVYKIYKNDNVFFNENFRDLSGKDDRFSFTKKDFFWNQALSPSIYQNCRGVSLQDGVLHFCDDSAAHELMIVMHRVHSGDILFEKLLHGKVSEDDCYSIGAQLAQRLRPIQKPVRNYDFFETFGKAIIDVQNWTSSVFAYISAEELRQYGNFLDLVRQERREWFTSILSQELVTDGDFHCHNAVFANNTLDFMDTFPPKAEWEVGHRLTPFYRIGTDIWALTGKKTCFEEFRRGYEGESGFSIDRQGDDMFVVYAASIAVSYLYMLQRTDPTKRLAAERFHTFLRDYTAERGLVRNSKTNSMAVEHLL